MKLSKNRVRKGVYSKAKSGVRTNPARMRASTAAVRGIAGATALAGAAIYSAKKIAEGSIKTKSQQDRSSKKTLTGMAITSQALKKTTSSGRRRAAKVGTTKRVKRNGKVYAVPVKTKVKKTQLDGKQKVYTYFR